MKQEKQYYRDKNKNSYNKKQNFVYKDDDYEEEKKYYKKKETKKKIDIIDNDFLIHCLEKEKMNERRKFKEKEKNKRSKKDRFFDED